MEALSRHGHGDVRIDAVHRDVVGGYDLLLRNLERDHAQIDLRHAIDAHGENEKEAGTLQRDETPESEDHSSFIFLGDLDR